MNKLAAYQVALEQMYSEKNAEYIIDLYGTADGYMPAGYLEAFAQKEAAAQLGALGNIGKSLMGRVTSLGKTIKGTSKDGVRASVGNYLTGLQKNYKDVQSLRNIGGAATGLGAAGLAGGGFAAGRMTS